MGRDANTRWVIRSDRVVHAGGAIAAGWVEIGGGLIRAVGRGAPPAGLLTIDVSDRYVIPGLVDLHVHGGGERRSMATIRGRWPVRYADLPRSMHGTARPHCS